MQLISFYNAACLSVIVSAAEKQLVPAQIKEHTGVVLDLIEMYLKGEFITVVDNHNPSLD